MNDNRRGAGKVHYFSKPKDIIISVKSKTFRLNIQLPSSHFTFQKNTTPRLPISMSPAVLFMVCHLSAHLPKINIENTQLAWVDSMVPKKLEPKNNQTTNIKHTVDKRTQSALKLIFFFSWLGLVSSHWSRESREAHQWYTTLPAGERRGLFSYFISSLPASGDYSSFLPCPHFHLTRLRTGGAASV